MNAPFMRHLFYAGQLHASFTINEWGREYRSQWVPDGAYLLQTEGPSWYLYQWCSFTPINLCDVPAELQMLCMLLDIPFK